jgi:hypothetical protein
MEDFGFLKKSGRKGPAHPDFGLMSRSLRPLLASLFRSEGFRSPLEPFPTVAQIKIRALYTRYNPRRRKSCGDVVVGF